MLLKGLRLWIRGYSRTLRLSLACSEIWFPWLSHKYMAAPRSRLEEMQMAISTSQMLWCSWRMLAVTTLRESTEVIFSLCEILNLMSFSRVNAVETLYAAFPALMYIDPHLGAPLLEPLFRVQASPDYSIQYAPKDLGMSHSRHRDAKRCIFSLHCIGSNYPNVNVSMSTHSEGVERSWITSHLSILYL